MCFALFVIGSAQAVHNTGLFQLDGNAQTAASVAPNTDYGPGGLVDWDAICKLHLQTPDVANQPGPFCHPSGSLPGAVVLPDRSTFVTDAFLAATDNIYKGGTDDGDITAADGIGGTPWQWKEAGPSPNKADIEQAFAAQYTCTKELNEATPSKCGADYVGHKLLFFGGTRFANQGDTNIGLWFLHNPVTLLGANATTDPTTKLPRCVDSTGKALTSGCGFNGTHTVGDCSLVAKGTKCTPGDLFVQSAFTSKPTISVFEWVGPGKAKTCVTSSCDLQQIQFTATASGDNKCEKTGTTSDPGCAIVNDAATVGNNGEIPSPWLFQDQSSKSAANKIEDSELYEGGLDLTGLGFGDECISTVLLNTRSSGSSINSTGQDFAIGSFGGCSSKITTAANGPTGDGSIGTGTVSSGTDSATVTVDGIATWGGNVDFYICGPTSGSCDTTGVKASTVPVTQSTTFPIKSDDASRTSGTGTANLTSAGRYCWHAVFTPDDATGKKGVLKAEDLGVGECFTVTKVKPALDTQAVDKAGANQTTPVDFGGSVYDKGVLSGAATEPGTDGANGTYKSINATAGPYAGTITFTLKGPDGLAANCTDNAGSDNAAEKNPQVLNVNTTTGNGNYFTSAFTPNKPGVYHWIAVYANSASANNDDSAGSHNSDCKDTKEDVTIRQIPTAIATEQRWFPNDTATIVSTISGDKLGAGGTVDFTLYNDATCGGTGTAKYTEQQTLAGGANSEAVGTHNYTGSTASKPGGGTVSPFEITTTRKDGANASTGSYSWKVVYKVAAGDGAHLGISSSCTVGGTEKFATTYTNDNSGAAYLP
ncbi:MAG: hypothetical protein ACJ76I_07270 [Gaiellaceae bacterium]